MSWTGRRRATVGLTAIGIVTVCFFGAIVTLGASATVLAQRPYAAASPWNTPIPNAPAIDANSASMVHLLTTGANQAVASIYAYGVPIYTASSTDWTYSVRCTRKWGTCPFAPFQVPIPATAVPATGTDHAMVVIDPATNHVYEFWKAHRAHTNGCAGTAPGCYHWTTAWGAVEALDGNGIWGVSGEAGATGSGDSTLAGLVRISELQAGHIDHALGFITHYTCASTFRYPAIKTDGRRRAPCIPEGARIQLDPSINVDAIPGMTPGERAVAHALQTYGAYSRDTGGTNLGFVFESPIDGQPNIYPAAGFQWDYWNMPHIPWNALRVLQS